MKNIFKRLVKLALISLVGFIGLVSVVGIYVYQHRDTIIKKAFEKITAQLPYPIQVKTIHLSIFEDFPKISIIFQQVVAYPTSLAKQPMLTAQKISGTFPLLALIRANYVLEHVLITDATLHISDEWVATSGSPATMQLVATSGSPATMQLVANRQALPLPLLIDIKKIDLQRLTIDYQGLVANKPCSAKCFIETLEAIVQHKHGNIGLQVDGKLFIKDCMYTPALIYQSNHPINLKARFSYAEDTKVGTIHQASIKQQDTHWTLQGKRSFASNQPFLELQIAANQLKVKSLLALLPKDLQSTMPVSSAAGHVNLTAQLVKQATWDLKTNFSFYDVSLLPTKFTKPIQLSKLVGTLAMPDLLKRAGTLTLTEGKAVWGNSSLAGTMVMDLQSLQYSHQGNLSLEVIDLLQAIQPPIASASLTGQIVGTWQFDKGNGLTHQPTCQLQLTAHHVSFPIGSAVCRLQDSTQINFQNHTLFLPPIQGDIDGKKFTLAGHVSHLNPMALSQSQPVYQATFYAEQLTLDSLFRKNTSSSDAASGQGWLVLGALPGTLTCEIEDFCYKNFRAKKLCGKLHVQPNKIHLSDVGCQVAKGRLSLDALGHLHPDHFSVSSNVALHQIDLPALFMAFDNFNQTFLQSRNLEGSITSNMQLNLKVDSTFAIDWHSIQADATIQLQEAVLKNFEPLQKLAPYTTEKKLDRLQFSHIKNDIHIEKGTITIPPMEIHTNLMSIELSGTHTLDGKINYNIVVPLEYADTGSFGQLGGINPMAFKGLNVYLKLEGDTSQYTIRFDGDLFRSNLQKNFTSQLDGLKKLFQGQKGKEQAKKLSKEFFDFD